MSNKEYNDLMAARKHEAYASLPTEFIQFIDYYSYERGHSAGQGECDSIACGIVADFLPYLTAYNKRKGIT